MDFIRNNSNGDKLFYLFLNQLGTWTTLTYWGATKLSKIHFFLQRALKCNLTITLMTLVKYPRVSIEGCPWEATICKMLSWLNSDVLQWSFILIISCFSANVLEESCSQNETDWKHSSKRKKFLVVKGKWHYVFFNQVSYLHGIYDIMIVLNSLSMKDFWTILLLTTHIYKNFISIFFNKIWNMIWKLIEYDSKNSGR